MDCESAKWADSEHKMSITCSYSQQGTALDASGGKRPDRSASAAATRGVATGGAAVHLHMLVAQAVRQVLAIQRGMVAQVQDHADAPPCRGLALQQAGHGQRVRRRLRQRPIGQDLRAERRLARDEVGGCDRPANSLQRRPLLQFLCAAATTHAL